VKRARTPSGSALCTPSARVAAVAAFSRFVAFTALALASAAAGACGPGAPEPATPRPADVEPAKPAGTAKPAAPAARPATAEEARAFFAQVDKDLRRLWVARDRALWVNENFITDDTEAIAAAGEEATAAYVTTAIQAARRFDGLKLPDYVARQALLLKLAQTVPAPSDPKGRSELAALEVGMTGAYGKAKYCPPRLRGKCLTLDDLSKTLATSRDEAELREAWIGWHDAAAPLREKFARYVELGNQGAREIGFDDLGATWRSGYDMPADAFSADIERLWADVKPLYDELHCYVRAKLRAKYGKDKVPERGAIPAHLLGNMWAQEWNNIDDIARPYAGAASLDVTKTLKDKGYDAKKMVKLGEGFFVSLGFDPLPETFWERSLLVRPKDREVVCHPSAWDPAYANDLRVKMCIQPTEEDLVTIHHELGHDYYYNQYYKLPILFQQGANDGFHEGIGDTLALSVTPAYLKSLGLLASAPDDPKALIHQQMKMALEKVAFLPFGLMIDKWRWDVFSGKITPDKYNQAWWDLRLKYQGVAPPSARTEQAFDPGAKFHVPASTPYIRYFLARIYQFQFHRALCKAAGYTGPLEKCSIHGSKAAGEKLASMLKLGASRPWQDAMRTISGEDKGDASALLEYFKPLREFLKEANKGQTCGW